MAETQTRFHPLHGDSNKRLLGMLPCEQLTRVMHSDMCDIEPEFPVLCSSRHYAAAPHTGTHSHISSED
jgi:hypothetical protein